MIIICGSSLRDAGGDVADEIEEGVEEGGIIRDMVLEEVRFIGEEMGIGMAADDVEPVAAEGVGLLRPAVDLQVDVLGHERGDGGLVEGIAGGDVDLLDFLGQAVDDGLQQFLVAEHDGGAASVGDALGGEPLADVAGLDVLRRGGDVGDLAGRLFFLILIEDGLALGVETAEEGLLHLLQQVEAHEGVGVVFELDGGIGGHLAVEGSLVGELLTGEGVVKGVVDVADVTPQAQEALLEFGVMVVGEVAEEAAYHLALFVGEVRDVVELVDVAQVGKHLVGRAHVLVEVVEVGEQQLSPAVEVVEGLVDARTTGEALVEFADEQDGVGDLQL